MSSGGQQPEGIARDQSESPFATILAALVARVPGARAAALVDSSGETVDYAGQRDPHAIRVAAAYWRIVLRDAQEQMSMAPTATLTVRASRAGFIVHSLPEGYALVVLLAPHAGLMGFGRAIASCAVRLSKEAGWAKAMAPAWYAVDVLCDAFGRPNALRLAGTTQEMELLGRCADKLAKRERAWRVRLPAGVEVMLVREPGGFWYTDEPLDDWARGDSKAIASRDAEKKAVDRSPSLTRFRRPTGRRGVP